MFRTSSTLRSASSMGSMSMSPVSFGSDTQDDIGSAFSLIME